MAEAKSDEVQLKFEDIINIEEELQKRSTLGIMLGKKTVKSCWISVAHLIVDMESSAPQEYLA